MLRLEIRNNKKSVGETIGSDVMPEKIDKNTLIEDREMLLGELQNDLTFEQLITYKKQIVDAGLQNKIDLTIQKIKNKKIAYKFRK